MDDVQAKAEAGAGFVFLRRLRGAYNSLANKIGTAILLTIVSGILWLIWVGFQSTTK